jgi:hypothetical protein
MIKYFREWRRRRRPRRDDKIRAVVNALAPLTDKDSHPNFSALWPLLKDIDVLRMNVKTFGYDLSRRLSPLLPQVPIAGEPAVHGLISKPTTQADVESPWFVYWCRELQVAPLYLRKLWEYAYILQALYDAGLLRSGVRGIGFGCGEEPLPSYFAAKGLDVLVTDLPPEQAVGRGWSDTLQYAASLDKVLRPNLVDAEQFRQRVRLAHIDMNDIPPVEQPFDFCWSACSLEHLGSIEKGLTFVERSLDVIKPGGLAIHTTEFNYLREETLDHWPTVLFQRKHIEDVVRRLTAQGHQVLGPSFDVGDGLIDRFVDVPPFPIANYNYPDMEKWGSPATGLSLKLSVDGFPCTCYGLIIRKRAA